jgi:hypothetical protein
VPADQVYDAQANPHGVRCSLQDYMVNVFGRRAADGFAQRPFDNVGIEYGRKALASGAITPAQFVDLNSKAGAVDIDYNPTKTRAEADRPALERVYRSGAVDQADNLDKVAIIDLRGPDPGAFHDVYRTYVMRARLKREHGTTANQVLWRGQVPLLGDANYTDEAIVAMDEWLGRVEKDSRAVPLARKVLDDKPPTLKDRCTDGNGHDVDAAACDASVQAYSDPRLEAGMPPADDTIKCELKPLRRADYAPLQFTDAEWAAMVETYPSGVCDYTKPGVDRTPTQVWQSYQDAAGKVVFGGRALGAVPASKPVGASSGAVCTDRRRFTFRLRHRRGVRVVRVAVFVNGKRRVLRRGHDVRRVTIARLPRGRFRVRVVTTYSSGARRVSTRVYRGCTKTRPTTHRAH